MIRKLLQIRQIQNTFCAVSADGSVANAAADPKCIAAAVVAAKKVATKPVSILRLTNWRQWRRHYRNDVTLLLLQLRISFELEGEIITNAANTANTTFAKTLLWQ